jgi:hypothetical protein
MKEKHDIEEIYCRKLGHKLPFSYCRVEKGSLPCGRIRDCWFNRLDINGFLEEHYSESELESVFKPGGDKVLSLLELIEKAKKGR